MYSHLADDPKEGIRALMARGAWTEAERVARYYVDEHVDDSEGLLLLGEICRAENNPEEALSLFKQVLDIEASNPRAHYFAGLLYLERQEHTEAVRHLYEAVASPSYASWAYVQLARVYEDYRYIHKDSEQARRHLHLAIEQEITYPGAFLQLAARESTTRALGILQRGIQRSLQKPPFITGLLV